MIVILNFSEKPITARQRAGIVASIVALTDERYACKRPESCVVEVVHRRSVEETIDAIPLTDDEWRNMAVIPYVPDGTRFGLPLLAEVNRRRGYDWPIVRVKR